MLWREARGFSLIEVLVATTVLAVSVSALAQLLVLTGALVSTSRHAGIAQQAARERMEQLLALTFSTDPSLAPLTDLATDLTVTPQRPSGGPGLSTSPAGVLASNAPGFSDFLDARGRWLAPGPRTPDGASWVRRWAVVPLDDLPDTLMLQVIVLPARADGTRSMRTARNVNGAWLVSIRTRMFR